MGQPVRPELESLSATDIAENSDCAPTPVEGIYKVHAASTSTPLVSVDFGFEVLGPSSFQSNDGPLASGKINQTSLRLCDQSIGPALLIYAVERPATRDFCKCYNG